jgi:hypothetical protein
LLLAERAGINDREWSAVVEHGPQQQRLKNHSKLPTPNQCDKSKLGPELAQYSFGYNELFQEKLKSSKILIQVYAFGQGPFKNRLVKFRYIQNNHNILDRVKLPSRSG